MSENLSVSARDVLAYIAQQLADGFTGSIVIECYGGGVRHVKFTKTYRPGDVTVAPPPVEPID